MAGQPDTAPNGAGVKALSSRLLQMKFMKRGQVAEVGTKATASAANAQASPRIATRSQHVWMSWSNI
jgi:hypothetical protein